MAMEQANDKQVIGMDSRRSCFASTIRRIFGVDNMYVLRHPESGINREEECRFCIATDCRVDIAEETNFVCVFFTDVEHLPSVCLMRELFESNPVLRAALTTSDFQRSTMK